MIRSLADDYRKLPEWLAPGTTGPGDVTGIRPPSPVHPPLPINVDVSDLIRDIERAALAWEYHLAQTFWLPAPFWTKPVRQSVPLSLVWSAGIIERPPETQVDGYWQPSTIPDQIHSWMLETASTLRAQCLRLVEPPRRTVRLEDPCPACQHHTLMGRAGTDHVRCVTAGCGYTHTPVVVAA
jgi:hypothetical protein